MIEKKNFKKGEVIFYEGDFEMAMYDIVKGKVGIYGNYGKPDEHLLATLENFECFGEMGLVESKGRSATVVALENSEIARIDSAGFDEYFRSQPQKVIKIMQQMSDRLRNVTDDYLEACGTIAEYLEAEENNKPKSKSLLERMGRFVDVYRKSIK